MARRIASIDDVRSLARRRVPRMVFDYVDSGARAELTMRANRAAFDDVIFNPRMAVPACEPDLSTTVLGTSVTMPLLLSPCGGLRAVHPHGEAGSARAAHRAGTIFTLSSASGMSIEHVAAHAPGPKWFQLYFLGGRAGAERLVERAAVAGYGALVVTVDTIVAGLRESDVRNGMTSGPYVNARNIVQFAPHVAVRPRWLWNFARDGFSVELANAAALGPGGTAVAAADASMGMFAEPPTWDDIAWIRDAWSGPLLVKGVLTADDARHAADLGADGVVVSNHGGRQLDASPATIDVLPRIADAVAGRGEILLDGGVRRGADVVRALACGARAVLVGRPVLWGLAAGGREGVAAALGVLRRELDLAMALCGCPDVASITRDLVAP